LLHMGLPHRTARSPLDQQTAPEQDPLTAHIGDAIADALADADVVPTASEPSLSAIPGGLTDVDHAEPGSAGRPDDGTDPSTGQALHHEEPEATPLEDARPTDPNAAWLADLYSQFIDEPEAAANGAKKRRRGEPNPVDVAFKTAEQDGEAKVSTLKRLMGALKKL
ncbi:MAG: hypothetical protein ABI239_08970, partial [Aquihabitans sp.]